MSIILTSIIRLLLNKRLEKTKEAIKNGQSETNPKEQARINNPERKYTTVAQHMYKL
jgi:hypothetical protein